MSVENDSVVGKCLGTVVSELKDRVEGRCDHLPPNPCYIEGRLFPLGREKIPKFLWEGYVVTPNQRCRQINSLRKGLLWFHNFPLSLWISFWLFYEMKHDSKPKTNEDFLLPDLKKLLKSIPILLFIPFWLFITPYHRHFVLHQL